MTQPRSTFRFSFASMLIGTAVLAFVVYATVYPSVWAASLAFSSAMAILALAVVRGLSTAGLPRRYWLAVGLTGFAYLALLYAPVLDERVGPTLVTTVGFAGVESLLYDESRDRPGDPERRTTIQRSHAISFIDNSWYPLYRAQQSQRANRILPQETWAARAFHSVMAVVCGMIAGWVAAFAHGRDDGHTKQTDTSHPPE